MNNIFHEKEFLPQVKVKLEPMDRYLEYIAIALIPISFMVLAFFMSDLPDEVRIYFNKPVARGIAPKEKLWYVLLTGGTISMVLLFLSRRPGVLNYYPIITKENAEFNYRISSRMLRVLSILMVIYGVLLTAASIRNGLGDPTDFRPYFYPLLPIILVAVIIYHSIALYLNHKKEKKANEESKN